MAITKELIEDKIEIVESTEVQGIATAVWTTAIKNAKKTANENASI